MPERDVTPPLILLPGLASGAALFRLQQPAFPSLVVPEWTPARRNESLEDYAARFAETIPVTGPCVVGGVSFGGIVAQELAKHLPAVACVVISSIRHPRELPRRFRVWTPFARVLPGISSDVSGWLALALRRAGRWHRAMDTGLAAYAAPDGGFVRWGAIAVLRWKAGPPPCPVLQIHGEVDRVFPSRRVRPDQRVPGAGHLLTLTHAPIVNQFLRDALDRTRCVR